MNVSFRGGGGGWILPSQALLHALMHALSHPLIRPPAMMAMSLCLLFAMADLASADMKTVFAAIESENYELARQELEPLAEAGNQNAQYNLGVLHQNGLGTKKSRRTAAKWFHKSAEQGNENAAFALGMMYATGEGTKLDPVEAYVWFWIASRKGNDNARKNIHRISRSMSLDQITEARKLFDERIATMPD